MERNFGGPVWHASARDLKGQDGLKLARLALKGVGGDTVEEIDQVNGITQAGQIRKRLSPEEQDKFNVQLQDLRGQPSEVKKAWDAAWPWLKRQPENVIQLAVEEVAHITMMQ